MSFSFRNIFSPDEENTESGSTGWQLAGSSTSPEVGRGNSDSGKFGTADDGRYFQSFLVSELIAFIPTAIAAQSGIPMQREVAITMPGDGSRDVKLSTLYRVCPELFAAEITPLNDSVITLPPKLGMPPSTAKASDSGSVASWSAGPPLESNPFWAPGQKGDEVGAPPQKSDMKDEKPQFRQDETTQWSKAPIGSEKPLSSQSAPQQNTIKGSNHLSAGPGAMPPGPGGAGGFEIAEGLKGSGLAPSSGFFDGFSASQAPPSVTGGGEGGMQPPKNHAPDKGGKPFQGNPFESEQGFSTLFSKQAAEDSELPFPTGSVPAGPFPGEVREEPQGVWGAMFNGTGMTPDEQGIKKEAAPFSPPSFENIGNLLKQGAENPEPPAAKDFSAFPNVLISPAFTPMTAQNQMSPAQDFSAFQAAASAAPASPPPPFEAKSLQVSWTPEPKIESEVSPLPETGSGTSVYSSFNQAANTTGKGGDATQPVVGALPGNPGSSQIRASGVQESVSPRPAASAVEDNAIDRDLELRAIFSLSETFTLSLVARCVVDLPGIISCSITTPGKLVQASRSEEGKIGSEAREMISTIRNLAKLTGLPEARTFTLHTDRGIVSLFLEGEYCVTVHHDKATFQPGIREKLILVARSLIKLGE